MRIVFRADSSEAIGTGHVMRCLTLAAALREKGAGVEFVCRNHAGNLEDLISRRGFPVFMLEAGVNVKADARGYAGWLGASWERDADQTLRAVEKRSEVPDWLIVDHYAVDHKWEERVRPAVRRIMAIDDLADRRHDCDLLLDQNLVAEMLTRYDGKTPSGCALLLGPEFALLQPAYAELHSVVSPRGGRVRRVLISFGGGNDKDLTARSLAAFLDLGDPDVEADVVLRAGAANAEAVRRLADGHSQIRLHFDPPSLAELIARADLGIGAGGATNWERLCLGVPTIVITMAANQEPVAKELEKRRLIRWLGDESRVSPAAISAVLGDIIEKGMDAEWSARCLAAVDGKGTERVAARLIAQS